MDIPNTKCKATALSMTVSTKVETDASIRNSVQKVMLYIILVGSIAIVWTLISLPIIFHFLPQKVLLVCFVFHCASTVYVRTLSLFIIIMHAMQHTWVSREGGAP